MPPVDQCEEPVVNGSTVVSDDIWKKFDLDTWFDGADSLLPSNLLDDLDELQTLTSSSSSTADIITSSRTTPTPTMSNNVSTTAYNKGMMDIEQQESGLYHDCMWMGFCGSKDHSRGSCVNVNSIQHQVQSKIPAGHSLLIANNNSNSNSNSTPIIHQKTNNNTNIHHVSNKLNYDAQILRNNANNTPVMSRREQDSDGDSIRSPTPEGSVQSDNDLSDPKPLRFEHDKIQISDLAPRPTSLVDATTNNSQINNARHPFFNFDWYREESSSSNKNNANVKQEKVDQPEFNLENGDDLNVLMNIKEEDLNLSDFNEEELFLNEEELIVEEEEEEEGEEQEQEEEEDEEEVPEEEDDEDDDDDDDDEEEEEEEDEELDEETKRRIKEAIMRNNLMSDHCYHINRPSNPPAPINKRIIKTENLGVQTPSDSGELLLQ